MVTPSQKHFWRGMERIPVPLEKRGSGHGKQSVHPLPSPHSIIRKKAAGSNLFATFAAFSKHTPTMAHRLNTNKQFMVGNGILAFAVIFVVVIFVYMSMRLQQQKNEERNFTETYTITLTKGFAGDSLSLLVNDSLLARLKITEEPFEMEVKRFAEQSALMIVDNLTDRLSLFELSEKGGNYRFEKENGEVKQLPQTQH